MRLGCLQITRRRIQLYIPTTTTTTTTTPITITPYSAVTTTTTTTTTNIYTLLEGGWGQRRLCTKDVVYPWKHRSHRVYSFTPTFRYYIAAAHTDVDLFCCLFNSGCNGVVYSTTLVENICQNVHHDRSPNRKLSDLRQKLKSTKLQLQRRVNSKAGKKSQKANHTH